MRFIILWSFVLCSLCLHAQNEDDSIRANKDPYYLQLFVGINKSANENLPWTEFTKYPWSGGLFIGLGREVSPLWGWRGVFRLNHNKSRNVQNCESYDTYGWNNWALFADATFDLTDAFRSKKGTKPGKFNMKAFGGVGLANTWGFDDVPLSYTHAYSRASKVVPALRAGITATSKLSRKWRVGAELSHTVYGDHFNGVAYDFPLDGRTNLKVGLTYLFAKKVKRLAKPIVRIIKLKECPPLPLLMPDPEDIKLRQIQGHAFLDFPVNETVIYPDYRNNPNELARIHASVDSVLFDKAVSITRISLHGYASPESPYSNNTRLAKGRTEALKNYLMRKYNFDSQVFKTNFTPEDWDNLRGFLTESDTRKVKGDFWYESKDYVETPEVPEIIINHRNELLRIIDRKMDPDAKEELLKRVGGGEPYRWLLEYVYPGLRHTDYIIEYKVRAFSVEKGRKLIYTHPEAMSMEEMYNVAMSYEEGSENWLDALLIAVEQFPEDETANLNAACGCVMTKRLVDAKKYLQKAGTTRQAKYVSNVIKAMEGSVNWKVQNGRVVVIE